MKTCKQHDGQSINLVCFAASCNNRLGCIQCVLEQHTNHAEQCQFLEDILNNDGVQQHNDYMQILEQQQVEATTSTQMSRNIDSITETIMLKFDGLESELNQHYNDNNTNANMKSESQFLQNYSKYQNIDIYKQVYEQYRRNEITRSQLNTAITEYLTNVNRKTARSEMISQYLLVRDHALKSKVANYNVVQKSIRQQLQELKLSIVLENSITLYSKCGFDSTIVDGNQVAISNKDMQGLILSTNIYTYPNKYTVTIDVQEFDCPQTSQLFIGFMHYAPGLNYNSIFKQGTSVYCGLSNHQIAGYSVLTPDNKIMGDSIREKLHQGQKAKIIMNLDLSQNGVAIQFEDIVMEYSKKKAQSIYGDYQLGVIDQFFSKNDKIVMFIAFNMAQTKFRVD